MTYEQLLQQMFDEVAVHLLTQQAKAQEDEGGLCRYRAPNGNRCAIGCLIAPEHYTRKLEVFSIGDPIVQDAVSWSIGHNLNDIPSAVDLLNDLREVHDRLTVNEWPTHLRAVASRYKLDDSVLGPMPEAYALETL
jgi:hypothetical protein